jgi:hypothetical protein
LLAYTAWRSYFDYLHASENPNLFIMLLALVQHWRSLSLYCDYRHFGVESDQQVCFRSLMQADLLLHGDWPKGIAEAMEYTQAEAALWQERNPRKVDFARSCRIAFISKEQ